MEVAHKMLILELLSYFVLNYVKLYTIITYAYIGNMDINRGQPLNGGIKVNWGGGGGWQGLNGFSDSVWLTWGFNYY